MSADTQKQGRNDKRSCMVSSHALLSSALVLTLLLMVGEVSWETQSGGECVTTVDLCLLTIVNGSTDPVNGEGQR